MRISILLLTVDPDLRAGRLVSAEFFLNTATKHLIILEYYNTNEIHNRQIVQELNEVHAHAVEYDDYLCQGVRTPPPNKCPEYDIKQSHGEAPGLELWRNMKYPFFTIAPRSALAWSGNSC